MKTKIISCLFSCLLLNACSSNLSRTERGDVLDDKVTTQRVQAELSRAGKDFKEVHANATNGVVVLSGSVSSAEIRSRAEQIVAKTHRDSRVEDKLELNP
jgi:osmotically-inducible protein OsmY